MIDADTMVMDSKSRWRGLSGAGLLAGLLLLSLTGCGGRSADSQATIVAQHHALSTEMGGRRATATFSADQLQITTEFVGTQLAREEDRQLSIISTLEAVGVRVGAPSQITPVIVPPTLRPGEAAGDTGAVGGVTRIAPTPEAREVTPTSTPDLNIPPTLDPTAPALLNLVVADSVGADDCATTPGAEFDVTTATLYAVGIINNFPPEITITFTWSQNGQPLYTTDWTWSDTTEGSCLWYSFTGEDFPFTPGVYTLALTSAGQPMAIPVTFVLVDRSGAAVPPADASPVP